MTTEPLHWYKSSYSENGGNCVEVATNLVATQGTIGVRDSKNPAGPALSFPANAFAAFVTSVQNGEFGTV